MLQEGIKQFLNGFYRIAGKGVGQCYAGALQRFEHLFVVQTVHLDAKRLGLIHRRMTIIQPAQFLNNTPQQHAKFAILRPSEDRLDHNLQGFCDRHVFSRDAQHQAIGITEAFIHGRTQASHPQRVVNVAVGNDFIQRQRGRSTFGDVRQCFIGQLKLLELVQQILVRVFKNFVWVQLAILNEQVGRSKEHVDFQGNFAHFGKIPVGHQVCDLRVVGVHGRDYIGATVHVLEQFLKIRGHIGSLLRHELGKKISILFKAFEKLPHLQIHRCIFKLVEIGQQQLDHIGNGSPARPILFFALDHDLLEVIGEFFQPFVVYLCNIRE